MSDLKWDASLKSEDLDLLIEMLGEWEKGGDHSKLQFILWLKNLTMPEEVFADCPDDVKEKVAEALGKMKEEFLPQERKARAGAKTRSERSVLLRAKLMLLQQNMAAEKFLSGCESCEN